LSREDWIAIARKALIASGVDDVKVDVLAKRLKVTRGSFYWHFKHRQELLDALLDDWQTNNRREIAVVTERSNEPAAGLSEMFQIWLGEDPSFPAFDLAIRVWARKSRKVANLVGEIDESWVSLFQSLFERSGVAAPEAFVRARILYFHQVGYYALAINESLDERIKLAPYYYAALIGQPAPENMEKTLRENASRKPRAAKPKVSKKPA
jgi:AcrR family transcriptional regulator